MCDKCKIDSITARKIHELPNFNGNLEIDHNIYVYYQCNGICEDTNMICTPDIESDWFYVIEGMVVIFNYNIG